MRPIIQGLELELIIFHGVRRLTWFRARENGKTLLNLVIKREGGGPDGIRIKFNNADPDETLDQYMVSTVNGWKPILRERKIGMEDATSVEIVQAMPTLVPMLAMATGPGWGVTFSHREAIPSLEKLPAIDAITVFLAPVTAELALQARVDTQFGVSVEKVDDYLRPGFWTLRGPVAAPAPAIESAPAPVKFQNWARWA